VPPLPPPVPGCSCRIPAGHLPTAAREGPRRGAAASAVQGGDVAASPEHPIQRVPILQIRLHGSGRQGHSLRAGSPTGLPVGFQTRPICPKSPARPAPSLFPPRKRHRQSQPVRRGGPRRHPGPRSRRSPSRRPPNRRVGRHPRNPPPLGSRPEPTPPRPERPASHGIDPPPQPRNPYGPGRPQNHHRRRSPGRQPQGRFPRSPPRNLQNLRRHQPPPPALEQPVGSDPPPNGAPPPRPPSPPAPAPSRRGRRPRVSCQLPHRLPRRLPGRRYRGIRIPCPATDRSAGPGNPQPAAPNPPIPCRRRWRPCCNPGIIPPRSS